MALYHGAEAGEYFRANGGWRLKRAAGGCATKPAYAGWNEHSRAWGGESA
jgi:hypothetical protein